MQVDLVVHDALGYVGLKRVSVMAAGVPEALANVVSADDLRRWVADTLDNGGIKVMTQEEYRRHLSARPASPSDLDFLRWSDDSSDTVIVSLTAVPIGDGSVSFSSDLRVVRPGIIMPGWMKLVTVDTVDGAQHRCTGPGMKEEIRQTVTQAALQIVSRYQYANRPSDAATADTEQSASSGG